MPVKTYQRVIFRLFSREELAQLFKEAHAFCKRHVPYKLHQIGQKRKRTVISRSREDLLDCIKAYIRDKVVERAKEIERSQGIKIEGIEEYLTGIEELARKFGIQLG